MKRIVYTGPIADFYQGELRSLLINYGFDFFNSRVDGGKNCNRPVIVIDIPAEYVWIEYVSEDISQYNADNAIFTCSVEEVKDAIGAMQQY